MSAPTLSTRGMWGSLNTSGLWTHEIEAALKGDALTRPVFGGVFPSNKLPRKIGEGQRIFVANTDPAGEPGQHWVALYFHPEGGCSYFDSYGLQPIKEPFVQFMEDNSKGWIFTLTLHYNIII